MFIGISIISTSVLIAIPLVILFIHFVFDRIDREEQLLVMIFGNEYLEYMKRTKMLIPFVF